MSLALVAPGGVAGWLAWEHSALDRATDAARSAGYVEKDARVDGAVVHYAEGPANGRPPLLLIHGQSGDWRAYGSVMPELAKDFHVYVVDVFGHGRSDHDPALYSVVAHGEKLAGFMREVIGEPAYVSGHSSGGVLASWLAGHAQPQVRGTLLEDPPLFTTTLPRAATTWNYVDLATSCHDYLASGSTDWAAYQWEHQRMWRFFKGGEKSFIDEGLRQHAKNPNKPISVWFAPQFDRGNAMMQHYDPRFGDTFYTGTWNDGFDEEATLKAIKGPTVLVHTKVAHDDQGILMAAMGYEEAERARSLIPGVRFVKVETGHEFHQEDPKRFVALLRELAAR
ncbi:alpha/beta hydrolase [Mariniluteicoccus endophyticus]